LLTKATLVMPRTKRSRAPTPSGLALGVLACITAIGPAGCWNDIELPNPPPGFLGGQVVLSGGVRGARVSADQIDLETGEVRYHIGETVTSVTGHYEMEAGIRNGIFKITAKGGAFEDLATGATIQLDDTDEMVSLTWFTILDRRDDALVGPLGHLVAARTMERLQVLGNMTEAFEESRKLFHQHFGDVDWGEVRLWPLDQHAPSPTEPVRAAFVHAALSVLARDIAAAAQAGPQEVNVYRLIEQWAEDLRSGTFDGDDGDNRASDSGLQLGTCPPADPGCTVPGNRCATSYCRPLCDLYSGTPRGLLAGALLKVINDSGPGGLNQTGIDLSSTTSLARGVAYDLDSNLFDDSCTELLELDQIPPGSAVPPGGVAPPRQD
jgi:hypothetical protein